MNMQGNALKPGGKMISFLDKFKLLILLSVVFILLQSLEISN